MKELSDNEFDKLLKQKADSYDFDYDESAWMKMESKLKRRDRIIFFRNSSAVLLLLILFGGTYLVFKPDNGDERKQIIGKTISKKTTPPNGFKIIEEDRISKVPRKKILSRDTKTHFKLSEIKSDADSVLQSLREPSDIKTDAVISLAQNSLNVTQPIVISQDVMAVKTVDIQSDSILSIATIISSDSTNTPQKEVKKASRRLSMGFTTLAGPEFSSVKSQSPKGSINIGILVNAYVSSTLTISSGIKYGVKNYTANGSTYEGSNPSKSTYLSGIDASCNILEIPVQMSYAFINSKNRKIQFSTGLSSYLMLKERYNFMYSPYSGYKNYVLEKTNANQHYFGVLNISASYQLKTKSPGLKWAIEPYMKLPLGGVGEGNVRLRSSGISLNMIYDIRKKDR